MKWSPFSGRQSKKSQRSRGRDKAQNRHRPGYKRFRPALELLEDRTLPSVVNWTNPNGGDWDTPGNWSSGSVPGAADDAVINISLVAGAFISHSQTISDAIHSVTSSDPIKISAGTLTIASSSTISSSMDLSGGTINGAGDLIASGPFNWTGGTLAGTGKTVASSTLNLSGGTHLLQREL